MNKIFKIFFFNLFFLFSILVIIELIFGMWFEKINFGPDMRGKRLQKIIYYHQNNKILYNRDFYGFRENNNNEKYDVKKIDILFSGGSTGDEQYLNYEETVVGRLNQTFKNENLNIKITNASLNGKSLSGNINEFKNWFDRIPDLSPKVIIYYLGLNDTFIKSDGFLDFNLKLNYKKKIQYEIASKSFFYNKLKLIKDRYLPSKISWVKNINDPQLKKLINNPNNKFYNDAINQFVKNNEIEILIANYLRKLKLLKNELDERDIKPIFITQIRYDVLGDKKLFFLNQALKEFCLRNKYSIIKLDEMIDQPINNFFIDENHVDKNGSNYIASKIYPKLKSELKYLLN